MTPESADLKKQEAAWRRFVRLFMTAFGVALALGCAFILLIDPYGVVPFSLPIERPLVEGQQRLAYARVIRSGRFDSLIVGSSTVRSLDPRVLNEPFGARFANLSIVGGRAGEQFILVDFFVRKVGAPKVLIVGLDFFWCDPGAEQRGFLEPGFPEWLYDDNPWNDYLNIFNNNTLEAAGRIVGAHLGLYNRQYREDGHAVVTPPDAQYDLQRARKALAEARQAALPWLQAADGREKDQRFTALDLLDRMLARAPSSRKVLVHLPLHISTQGTAGSISNAILGECKARIVEIAQKHGAQVMDWLIESPITTDDSNYWDSTHFRIGVAHLVERGLIDSIAHGKAPAAGSFSLPVR